MYFKKDKNGKKQGGLTVFNNGMLDIKNKKILVWDRLTDGNGINNMKEFFFPENSNIELVDLTTILDAFGSKNENVIVLCSFNFLYTAMGIKSMIGATGYETNGEVVFYFMDPTFNKNAR